MIDAAIAALGAHEERVEPGPTSTVVRGELGEVLASLADAVRAATESGAVLVATVANACPLA